MLKNKHENPAGLKGIEFIEYASPDPIKLIQLWQSMGFTHKGSHNTKQVELFSQGHINFVLNKEKNSFAEDFANQHGPSVCALGFHVQSAKEAFDWAIAQGAKAVDKDPASHSFPAIYGVGNSVIYFVDKNISYLFSDGVFTSTLSSEGLLFIDHLTHNVEREQMQKWCDFYEQLFHFTERRYFNIQGEKTGLVSKVMRSPCNTITIPINEPSPGEKGNKSQIQEYLDEYKGSGVQHIALATKDIVHSVQKLFRNGILFLDVPDTYYDTLAKRVPQIQDKVSVYRKNAILADGDSQGYLVQIFTKNVIGPIFYELIQRMNHDGFGEGNFQALFDAIEQDQIQRGYL